MSNLESVQWHRSGKEKRKCNKKKPVKLYYGRKICHLQTVPINPADCTSDFCIYRPGQAVSHALSLNELPRKLCMATWF